MSLPEESVTEAKNGLFPGDTGELPMDTRRVLVQLLSGPSIDGTRHSRQWTVLLRDEIVIRKFFCELFLELVIDRDLQVAFTRQADSDDDEIPKILRRTQLTFLDSVLLLYLRKLLAQAEKYSERAVVSRDDIIEELKSYDKTGNTDKAGFDKRIYASIEKIRKHNIIQKIKNSDNRFEISPTLKLLFSAEEIQTLINIYNQIKTGDLQMDNITHNEEGEDL
jgi:hypothetical protein